MTTEQKKILFLARKVRELHCPNHIILEEWNPYIDWDDCMGLVDKVREGGLVCCLTIDFDYHYSTELEWVYASDKKHTKHRGGCYDEPREGICEGIIKLIKGRSVK